MTAPTAFEQMTLELANRFRLDPAGEFARSIRDAASGRAEDVETTLAIGHRWGFGVDLEMLARELAALSPAQPLAWNPALARAAAGHTEALRAADRQSHQLPGEPGLGERAAQAGYDFARLGENVFAYARSAANGHDGFVIDWGPGPGGMQDGRGHRANLIDPAFAEIGVGAVAETDPNTEVGPYLITQNLGLRPDAGPFLLGAVWADADGDGFYSLGEGRGGMTLSAAGLGRVSAAESGGWALETGEGRFDLTLHGGAVTGRIKAGIEIGRENAKLDLVDGAHLRTSADLDLVRGARSVEALGVGDVSLSGKGGRDRLLGNSGDNTLSGEGGRDLLVGGAGDDRLWGGGGADRLKGGEGADILSGGAGRDRLWGGAGADAFVFTPGGGRDLVLDWEEGRDRLDLRGAALSESELELRLRGDDAIFAFAGGAVILKGAAGEAGLEDVLF